MILTSWDNVRRNSRLKTQMKQQQRDRFNNCWKSLSHLRDQSKRSWEERKSLNPLFYKAWLLGCYQTSLTANQSTIASQPWNLSRKPSSSKPHSLISLRADQDMVRMLNRIKKLTLDERKLTKRQEIYDMKNTLAIQPRLPKLDLERQIKKLKKQEKRQLLEQTEKIRLVKMAREQHLRENLLRC